MLRRSKIPMEKLFWGGIKLSFKLFKIKEVVVACDDSERERSKNCRFLPFVRKTICKATGGWVQAQNLVFIILVTNRVSIPVWYCFHRPSRLTKQQQKICKKNPSRVKEFDKKYRKKNELARIGLYIVSRMLKKLEKEIGIKVNVKCVTGDNGFASSQIQQTVSKYFDCQYISKANPKQKVKFRGKKKSLESFFSARASVKQTVAIRGNNIELEYKAARVFVDSFRRKVHVVALRYRDDKSWQYIFGTDLTWTSETLIKAYGLRWIVEVFFEDWKKHDGWGVGALQRSVEGARQGVLLSLLTDLFLLYHQRTDTSLHEHHRNELYSAGTVTRHLQNQAIHEAIENVLDDDDPRQRLEEVKEQMFAVVDRRISSKHLQHLDFHQFQSSPSLKARWGHQNRLEEQMQKKAMSA